jgi:hypothetical protein
LTGYAREPDGLCVEENAFTCFSRGSAALLHQLQPVLLPVEEIIGEYVQCLDERGCFGTCPGISGVLLLADAAFLIIDQEMQAR